ncbi:WXG100 family type VII secretion target [Actinoallomurus sp. NPDC050550]|uniref:WXG100 family type VII secretion target n=1 Tax=Actinoallomurus sp. NPDC050550 TaxID=3154937 RepID=UPI003407F247
MAVDHQTYVIKSGGRPQGAGSYGDAEAVKNKIAATKPGEIITAAGTYDAMGTALNDVNTAIYEAAKVLADHWSGPAADAAQEALRRLYGTAGELVIRSTETARTLQWYGGSILPMYRNINWPKNIKSPAATAAAAQVMKNLNERIAQTWDGMPPQIEKNLPRLQDPYEPIPTDPGVGSSGSGSGGGGSTGGRSPGSGGGRLPHQSLPPTSRHDHAHLPALGGSVPSSSPHPPNPFPRGTELAGLTPGGDGPGGGLNLNGGIQVPSSGGGAGGFGAQGTNPGAAAAPFDGGGFRPGYIGMPSAAGARPNLPGVAGGNSSGAPFLSGSGRGDEKERQRTTWLAEDQDIWTGDEVSVLGVIGESPNRVAEPSLNGDDILSPDELQQLLDLVDEQPGGEIGEVFGGSSDFDLADDKLSDICDAQVKATVGQQPEDAIDVDEASLRDIGIDVSDLLDVDDLGKRNSQSSS